MINRARILLPSRMHPRHEPLSELLSRGSREWRLHLQMIYLIWSLFGMAEVDLIASEELP